eukprot:12538751-Prorocentrum_lima.AAC.1
MTSSLVGSEMCIRDSTVVHRRALDWKRPQRRCGRRLHPHHPYAQPPVSYTHLTLPTICSV